MTRSLILRRIFFAKRGLMVVDDALITGLAIFNYIFLF
jgi:hypothetical protein